MRRIADNIWIASAVVIVAIAVVYLVLPIVMAILMSFDARDFLGPFPPTRFSLHWYQKLFGEPRYLVGVKVSLIVSTTAAAVSTVVGVMAAVALDRYSFSGKDLVALFFLSPLVVPGVVIGFALLLFLAMAGVFDGLTRLLLGHIIITVPYTVRTTLAGLVGIKRSLTEAALTLGANERQAFWDITFPLAKTGIVAGMIFAFVFSIDDVSMSMFLTDARAYTLSIALLGNMQAEFDLSIAAAAVLLVGFTTLVVFLLDAVVGIDRAFGVGMYRA